MMSRVGVKIKGEEELRLIGREEGRRWDKHRNRLILVYKRQASYQNRAQILCEMYGIQRDSLNYRLPFHRCVLCWSVYESFVWNFGTVAFSVTAYCRNW